MQSDAPSISPPDGSFKASSFRDRLPALWLTAAALIGTAIAASGYGIGLFSDDPLNLQTAEALSWARIFTLRHTPVPLHMAICKLALLVMPGDPATFIRLSVVPAHLFSGWLLWRLLARHVRHETAFVTSLVFLVYRPGTEAVFWAGAGPKESFMTMFALLTLEVWAGPKTGAKWLAILPAAGAVIAKPNGGVIIVLVAAYELAFPSQATRLDTAPVGAAARQGRWRWLLPLAVMLLVCGVLAVHARNNPGYYANYTRPPSFPDPWLYVSQFLQMLAAELLPFKPIPVNFSPGLEAAGVFVLAGLAAGLFLKCRDYLFALVWLGLFMVPPVLLTGLYNSRYCYAAGAGAVWILAVLYDRFAERAPKIALLLAAVWITANCILYADDLRIYRASGQVGIISRDLILAHRDELAGDNPIMNATSGFIVPTAPSTNVFFLTYYLGRPAAAAVAPGGVCPDRRWIPCVELHLGAGDLRGCYPDRMDRCIKWFDRNAADH